jgi:hypothetical protein
MWAMTLMHENKIKLSGGTIIPEVIECFVTAVFEVGSTCLYAAVACHVNEFLTSTVGVREAIGTNSASIIGLLRTPIEALKSPPMIGVVSDGS